MPTQYSSKVSRSSERGLDSPKKANGHKEMWFGVPDRNRTQILMENNNSNRKILLRKQLLIEICKQCLISFNK